jgi:hypothetical protein
MTPPDSGSLRLDTSQETIEGTAPYRGEVLPPASAMSHWAYSLVIEGKDPSVSYRVILLDPSTGEQVAADQADQTTDGIASIEAELHEQTYELQIESEQSVAFRAICTQTYGYRE